ncbi:MULTISPECIES: hypothetical protein [Caproicibacterium]|uniref:Uncharacterized protein n=1 Tax=Caproicibacterium argilliputei TaxID=3030016 RepID=A0AA97H0E5_9FIRM|nr:hypothetical protein [Caproicibacterium argilliputei]WOC31363.1 hypothetical protein PXC00_09030 [Caproicibacterium argilliputei]
MVYKPDELFRDCRFPKGEHISGFEQNNDRYCHIPDCSMEDALSGTNSTDVAYEGGVCTTGQTHANADERADRAAKKAKRSAAPFPTPEEKNQDDPLRRPTPPRFYP